MRRSTWTGARKGGGLQITIGKYSPINIKPTSFHNTIDLYWKGRDRRVDVKGVGLQLGIGDLLHEVEFLRRFVYSATPFPDDASANDCHAQKGETSHSNRINESLGGLCT